MFQRSLVLGFVVQATHHVLKATHSALLKLSHHRLQAIHAAHLKRREVEGQTGASNRSGDKHYLLQHTGIKHLRHLLI